MLLTRNSSSVLHLLPSPNFGSACLHQAPRSHRMGKCWWKAALLYFRQFSTFIFAQLGVAELLLRDSVSGGFCSSRSQETIAANGAFLSNLLQINTLLDYLEFQQDCTCSVASEASLLIHDWTIHFISSLKTKKIYSTQHIWLVLTLFPKKIT